jgi:putative endonuclease
MSGRRYSRPMMTLRQVRGTEGELAAVGYLIGHGWRVIARNIELGGVEVDILGVDPGPPTTLVVVEVRSTRSSRYGPPEEKIDRAKVARLYHALAAVRRTDGLVTDVSAASVRVDLVVVDVRRGQEEIRHLRALDAS